MSTTPEELQIAAAATQAANAMTDEAAGVDAKNRAAEREQVKRWQRTISEARDFDKAAYSMMGTCRGYAAGLSAYEVSVNVLGSNIDIMKAFLYARNPQVAVTPARQTSLPPVERPQAPVPPENPMDKLLQLPGVAGATQDPAQAQALLQSPEVAARVGPKLTEYQMQYAQYQMHLDMYTAQMQAYGQEMRKRAMLRNERKRFAETLDILVSKSWDLAELKEEMRANISTALTCGLGWIKMVWQEDNGMDPIALKKLNSLQENMQLVEELRKQATDPTSTPHLDQLQQRIAEIIAGMQQQKEVVVARGLVVDNISPEDITVPLGVTRVSKVSSYPWIDQRAFMRLEAAKVRYRGHDDETWRKATRYSQRKPTIRLNVAAADHPSWELTDASSASQFTASSDGKMVAMCESSGGDFICVHETWDKVDGLIRTWAEGMDCYLLPPHAPEVPITRFFPFFCVAPIEVDGERYPQSNVQRSYQLQDERNSRLTAMKRQRDRARQGILGDAGAIDKDEAGKINESVEGEITYVSTTGDKPIQNVFMAKPVVQLDPALYQVETIDRDIERIWGVQQALQGTVRVEQTATESEIQQQGFSARTAYMREPMEAALSDMSVATSEILLQRLTPEDAMAYAGPGAVWPEATSVSDLASLVTVSIKAGSSGKPNLSAERQAWSTLLPLAQGLIQQIGQLRNSDPANVADTFEHLLSITMDLSGVQNIPIDEITPRESMPQPQPQQADAGAPPAFPAPHNAAPPMPDDFAAGPTGPNNPNPNMLN